MLMYFILQVHERQTARMRTRSEWFLSPHYPTANNMSGETDELLLEDS